MKISVNSERKTPKSYNEQNGTPKRRKCQHIACRCSVENEMAYCSAYCEQAAGHGLERDYCQCEHECAPRFKPTVVSSQRPGRTPMLSEHAGKLAKGMLLPVRTEAAVVAVFRGLPEAQAAAAELTANAFAGDHIHLTSDASRSHPHTRDGSAYLGSGDHVGNLDNWLKAMFLWNSHNDRHRYDNVVRSGNVLLGVTTPEQMVDTAANILHHQSPIDLRVHRNEIEASSGL